MRPAAIYDTVTEGLVGWRFLRTGRWVGFFAAAVAFALLCCGLALWQFDRGRQASADNAITAANFNAAPLPIAQALPTLSSYGADQIWQRVSAEGTFDANEQLFVRNRSNGTDIGFEVLTPLRLRTGATLIVDRGWVAASTNDTTVPASRPKPPSGTVGVVVRLQPSEAARGVGGVVDGIIGSVDLTEAKGAIGGSLYTGAYGLLDTQSPPATDALQAVQTSAPTEGVGFHYSYTIQWILFIFIGFFLLGRAIRGEFRRLNAAEPEEQVREAARVQKRARKAFTDEESEDERLDGYVSLARWGFGSAAALPAGRPAPRALPAEEPAPEIYVLKAKAAAAASGSVASESTLPEEESPEEGSRSEQESSAEGPEENAPRGPSRGAGAATE